MHNFFPVGTPSFQSQISFFMQGIAFLKIFVTFFYKPVLVLLGGFIL